jgi:hypothetical protein
MDTLGYVKMALEICVILSSSESCNYEFMCSGVCGCVVEWMIPYISKYRGAALIDPWR